MWWDDSWLFKVTWRIFWRYLGLKTLPLFPSDMDMVNRAPLSELFQDLSNTLICTLNWRGRSLKQRRWRPAHCTWSWTGAWLIIPSLHWFYCIFNMEQRYFCIFNVFYRSNSICVRGIFMMWTCYITVCIKQSDRSPELLTRIVQTLSKG